MSSLVFERIYSAPIKKVWKAITDKNQMKEWYFALDEFKAEPGFEFSFYGGKDGRKYLHRCRIVDVDPVTRLSYTWAYDGYPGSSLVTFQLEELEAKKTKLTLTHSGLDTFPPDQPDFAPGNFNAGWTYITGTSLMEYVETTSIRKSIMIKAAAAKAWAVLLNPNGQWAKAFGEGTIAESEWSAGTPILWTDDTGQVGARGIIEERVETKKLVMQYFDEVEPQPGETLGEYEEAFELIDLPDGSTELIVDSGPLAKKYQQSHNDMWEKAVELIKSDAEG